MSEIIDKITEGAGQVISEFEKGGQIHSAISGIRQRMAESDRRRKINTIKKEIQDLHTKEAQAINSLSAQVLALYEAGSLSQPELVSLCKGVDEVRDQIREKEAELAQFQPPPSEQAQPSAGQSQLATAARCPSCGVPTVEGAAFCQGCGANLVEAEPPAPFLFCVHCGAQLREGARFCPKCGQTVPQSPA